MPIQTQGQWKQGDRLTDAEPWIYSAVSEDRKSLQWRLWDAVSNEDRVICRANGAGQPLTYQHGTRRILLARENRVLAFDPRSQLDEAVYEFADDLSVSHFWISSDGEEAYFVVCKDRPSRREMRERIAAEMKKDKALRSFPPVTVVQEDFRLFRIRGRETKVTEINRFSGQAIHGTIDWERRRLVGTMYPGNQFFEFGLDSGETKVVVVPKMGEVTISPSGRVLTWSMFHPGIFEVDFKNDTSNKILDGSRASYGPDGSLFYTSGDALNILRDGHSELVASSVIEEESRIVHLKWCECGAHFAAYETGGAGFLLDTKNRELVYREQFVGQGTWCPRGILE